MRMTNKKIYVVVSVLLIWFSISIVAETNTSDGVTIEASNLEQLKNEMTRHGWKVNEDTAGNLTLYPKTTQEETESDASLPTSGQKIDLDSLEKNLQDSGWKTGRDKKGNLLLYPAPNETATTPSGVIEKTSTPQPATIESQLEKRGWLMKRGRDGSLRLSPIENKATVNVTVGDLLRVSSLNRCMPDDQPVSDSPISGIVLPVDQWGEAHKLAKHWIKSHANTETVTVGKIRFIGTIYIVSIVNSTAPYALQEQLIIRTRDGYTLSVFD